MESLRRVSALERTRNDTHFPAAASSRAKAINGLLVQKRQRWQVLARPQLRKKNARQVRARASRMLAKTARTSPISNGLRTHAFTSLAKSSGTPLATPLIKITGMPG
jgi:hypothetical protein